MKPPKKKTTQEIVDSALAGLEKERAQQFLADITRDAKAQDADFVLVRKYGQLQAYLTRLTLKEWIREFPELAYCATVEHHAVRDGSGKVTAVWSEMPHKS